MGLGAKMATNALTATGTSGTRSSQRTKKDVMFVDYKGRKLVKIKDQVIDPIIAKPLEEEIILEICKTSLKKDSIQSIH